MKFVVVVVVVVIPGTCNLILIFTEYFVMTVDNVKSRKPKFDWLNHLFVYLFQVHANIVLLEAKLQAELLYVFRAISQYIDGRATMTT
jgi:hypothetical protein